MTIGMMAVTRLSTAAVVQVVHPRLEAGDHKLIDDYFSARFARAECRYGVHCSTALFVIGSRAGHFSITPS